jgi:hypothetical protein
MGLSIFMSLLVGTYVSKISFAAQVIALESAHWPSGDDGDFVKKRRYGLNKEDVYDLESAKLTKELKNQLQRKNHANDDDDPKEALPANDDEADNDADDFEEDVDEGSLGGNDDEDDVDDTDDFEGGQDEE